ncbi:MAG: VCBS repeat-containing protein, partial [Planctomycetes bacterium]|nr:VCBS repeat-containing protein [Planctomycetota bacterium]
MNHVSIMILCCATAAALLPAQESAALLHAPTVALGVDSPPFQKLGDFDGDGDLDVVGTRHFQSGSVGEVAVWRNDGGVFTKVYVASVPGMSWTNGASTMAVEVADLNGDGRDDFVVASRTRADRFLAQPYMQFVVQPWWLVGNSWGSRAITKGDFDGDGLVDIAVADPNGSNTRLFVFFGDGNWTDATVPVPMAQDVPVQLRASELDGQPGDELLLCSRSSFAANAYTVVNGQLVHQQQFTTTINIVSATPWLWAGGDIDQDGDADLVVFKPAYANLQPAAYQVFRRVGPASFVPEPVQSGGPAEYLADIDGDGDLDGVCCGGGGGGGPNYQWPKLDFASTFEIALNDGTGVFAPSFSFPGAGSESLAGVADLDGDGDL